MKHTWIRKSKTTSRCIGCNEIVKNFAIAVTPDDCTSPPRESNVNLKDVAKARMHEEADKKRRATLGAFIAESVKRTHRRK